MFAFLLSVFSVFGIRWRKLVARSSKDLREVGAAHRKISLFGALWRLVFDLAVAIYNAWFWFAGMRTDNENCPVYLFMFSKATLSGPTKYLFRAFAIIYILYKFFQFLFLRLGLLDNLLSSFWWKRQVRNQDFRVWIPNFFQNQISAALDFFLSGNTSPISFGRDSHEVAERYVFQCRTAEIP